MSAPAQEPPDRLLRLAVDLVNLPDAPDAMEAASLARFLVDHGEQPPIGLDERDARGIVRVRRLLAAVFDAAGVDAAAAAVNRLLARAERPPVLTNHDGSAWHLHLTDTAPPWADWLAAGAGLALARLVAEDGLLRIGRCAAPGCGRAFAGGPRNHRRRHCSPACANRARVASHRARRRLEQQR